MNTPDELPEDELVSAVLDGEADDATRARVAADPALGERLDTFRAIGAELHEFTIPDGLLDELRRTALDITALETTAAPPARVVAAPVFDLSARRSRRAKAAKWLTAAAAVVVLIAAIGFASGNGDDGDASLTTAFATGSSASSERATDAAGQASSAASPNGPAGAGASGAAASTGSTSAKAASSTGAPTAPTAAPRDLGTVANLDVLAATYRAANSAGGPPASTVPASPATTFTDPACGPVLAVAVIGERPVQLLAASPRIAVLDAATCAVIGTFTP
jgi:hypothetical protein